MAWTQADIDTLKQAILDRKGARTIAFGDQSVSFESLADMREQLAVMQQEVNRNAGTPRHVRFASTRKGV